MKAIIPLAGVGTRLRPLTHSKPKALIQVGSKPIISHIIDSIIPIGCSHLILIVGDKGETITHYVKKTYPEIKVESIIQKEQLGLGHAVSLAKDSVKAEEILIVYGDTIVEGDFTKIINRGVDGVIAVKEVPDPRAFGVVVEDKGFITQFVEKPSQLVSNRAIVGFNYFRTSDILFECIDEIIRRNHKTKNEYQITDAFQLMVGRGLKLISFPIDHWFDCGNPETLLETNRYLLAKEGNCESIRGSVIIPPVFFSPSVTVEQSTVGPNVSVGEGTTIEKSIISDSIIGSATHILNSSLTHSLIGGNVHVTDHRGKLILGDHSRCEGEKI